MREGDAAADAAAATAAGDAATAADDGWLLSIICDDEL